MDVCEDILNSGENRSIELNDEIFELVWQEFSKNIGHIFPINEGSTPEEKVTDLKNQYIYTSEYSKLFFDILARHNYDMRHEIKEAMGNLGHLENPNNNKELIKKLLGSPIIDDISFNGKNKFIISSEQYGEFVFELASYYFRKNKRITDYMKKNCLPTMCHEHVYFMSKVFADLYAITSLCRAHFKDNYYHSYTYDKEKNVIVDLCYNGIVDKDLYYHIFQPQEISVILNSKVAEELALTDLKTDQDPYLHELLKITLYKQYLSNIGYQGDLETAPSTKTK